MRDHGKDFQARRLCDPTPSELGDAPRWCAALPKPAEAPGVWATLGVTVHSAVPYSSWSKWIESAFGAFSRRFENQLPGWTGRSTIDRPELLDDHLRRGTLLTADEYVQVMAGLIDQWNTSHCVGERSRPPLAYYDNYVPRTADPGALTFLLQDCRRVRVRQGSVRLRMGGVERRYLSEKLALYGGQSVDVKFDPAAPDTVWAYANDGTCLAVPELPAVGYGEPFGATHEAVKRAGRAQREYVKGYMREIEGAAPLAATDPSGAYRLVAARLERAACDAAANGAARLAASAAEQQERALEAAREDDAPLEDAYREAARRIA